MLEIHFKIIAFHTALDIKSPVVSACDIFDITKSLVLSVRIKYLRDEYDEYIRRLLT
jgi:hypothetical protein